VITFTPQAAEKLRVILERQGKPGGFLRLKVVSGGCSGLNLELDISEESRPGDEVFAGTINGHGALDVRVTRLVRDTRLARIIHLVETAQASRAPVQAFVDRFARVYTPAVLALALVIALVPPLAGGAAAVWVYRALVLLVIAIPTIQVIFTTQGAARPDALQVVVVGRQWWWEFQYPTLGVVTANELHLPAGRRIVLQLEGEDVIHSFWVPLLGGKRDVVPGRRNLLTLTADAPGEYWGQCAEFCGASHANMRLRVIVDPPEAFEAWLLAQRVPAAEPTGVAAEGKAIYARSACVGCHVIRGLSAGTLGPDLTHFGSRSTVAAGLYPNTVEHVTAWLKDPPALKPGVKMPRLGLTDEQARAVATYLLSLK